MKSTLVPTIIITQDLHNHIRGYSLHGKEFYLKEPKPRKDEGVTLDGKTISDYYWVISVDEYVRVVPEAANEKFISNEVLIPTFVAVQSLRPSLNYL